MERYGVLPEQMTDLKALKGDTSDNIPGVPGVGDKTAIKLVQQFGAVEAMLDNVDDDRSRRSSRRLCAKRGPDPPEQAPRDDRRARAGQPRPSRPPTSTRTTTAAASRSSSGHGVPDADPAAARSAAGGQPAAMRRRNARHETTVRSSTARTALDERSSTASRSRSRSCSTRRRRRAEAMRADLVGLSIALGDGEAYYIPIGHAPRLGENGQLPLHGRSREARAADRGPEDREDGAQPEVRHRRAGQPRHLAAGHWRSTR